MRKNGFSLLELILVVAILAIVGGISGISATGLLARNSLGNNTARMKDNFRKAQAYSMQGKDGEVWGVCKLNNKIRIFSGSCAGATKYEESAIVGATEISEFGDIVFEKVSGETSALTTIILKEGSTEKHLLINQMGVVNEE